MKPGTTTLIAVAALALLTGCASNTPERGEPAQPTDSDRTAETSQDSPESTSDYLDELYSESLHEGVAPAPPGTAYIEVAGERFEFENLDCTINDQPGRGQFIVSASDDTSGSGHRLYFSREIGSDIGFNWENEHVQLALLTAPGGGESMGQYSNSMAQHSRDEGKPPEWLEGSGTSPLVRLVGNESTATGSLSEIMFADTPLAGEFIAAATCP